LPVETSILLCGQKLFSLVKSCVILFIPNSILYLGVGGGIGAAFSGVSCNLVGNRKCESSPRPLLALFLMGDILLFYDTISVILYLVQDVFVKIRMFVFIQVHV